ncbi:hypothetical protein F2Q68_00025914 [Brassica cretica]|uniref:Uncharacterized protein n=1 Tax=Brassica cretica TaxID=69181 RepID=A0A8S9IJJ1_BRACR|nr:hypothetical protein F2Q68_00025914 [Brassica cretica]
MLAKKMLRAWASGGSGKWWELWVKGVGGGFGSGLLGMGVGGPRGHGENGSRRLALSVTVPEVGFQPSSRVGESMSSDTNETVRRVQILNDKRGANGLTMTCLNSWKDEIKPPLFRHSSTTLPLSLVISPRQ